MIKTKDIENLAKGIAPMVKSYVEQDTTAIRGEIKDQIRQEMDNVYLDLCEFKETFETSKESQVTAEQVNQAVQKGISQFADNWEFELPPMDDGQQFVKDFVFCLAEEMDV